MVQLDKFTEIVKRGVNIFDEKGKVVNFLYNISPEFIAHEYTDSSWSLFGGRREYTVKVTLDHSKYLCIDERGVRITYDAKVQMFNIKYSYSSSVYNHFEFTRESMKSVNEFVDNIYAHFKVFVDNYIKYSVDRKESEGYVPDLKGFDRIEDVQTYEDIDK